MRQLRAGARRARVLLLGDTGLLGRALGRACDQCHLPLVSRGGADACDVSQRDQVWDVLREVQPTIVLNATGFTDVNAAERDFEAALHVNGLGPANLSQACRRLNALLVHFSSDEVFDGHATNPYRTIDTPDPINAYGLSKLAGEEAIIASGCEYLIIRTSRLFAPYGQNCLRTILHAARGCASLEIPDHQVSRPTFCADLAEMTLKLIAAAARRAAGQPLASIIHAANEGECSMYQFASELVRHAGLDCVIRPCPVASTASPAPRPNYSVLDLTELTELIGPPRHWRAALAGCLADLLPQLSVPSAAP